MKLLSCTLSLVPPAPPANAAIPGEESICEQGLLTFAREHRPTGDVKLLKQILTRKHTQIYPNKKAMTLSKYFFCILKQHSC